jgi:long-chain acyl-CoA synthetase
VSLGEPGEIAIRGPQVMAGYWQQPDETAKVMTADGYFKSGDVGVMDDRGYTRIVDRKKDMIIVSGFNVYPNEIEGVIAMHPGVVECAAVGIPDERCGEAVKVFVVRREATLYEDELMEWCRHQLTGLQEAEVHRVPNRPAEVERRQDPATRAAGFKAGRRGAERLTNSEPTVLGRRSICACW